MLHAAAAQRHDGGLITLAPLALKLTLDIVRRPVTITPKVRMKMVSLTLCFCLIQVNCLIVTAPVKNCERCVVLHLDSHVAFKPPRRCQMCTEKVSPHGPHHCCVRFHTIILLSLMSSCAICCEVLLGFAHQFLSVSVYHLFQFPIRKHGWQDTKMSNSADVLGAKSHETLDGLATSDLSWDTSPAVTFVGDMDFGSLMSIPFQQRCPRLFLEFCKGTQRKYG